MKKNLLIAALVIPLLSVSAQWTQTGGTVSVQPNTLKYVAQDYKVSGVGSKTTNEGNVNVRGNFTIDNETEPTTEFRNKFNSGTQYGQLILQDGSGQVVTGKIHNEFKLIDDFAYHSIALPFMNYSGGELVLDAEMGNVAFPGFTASANNYDVNRYKNPIFHWDLNFHVFDTPSALEILNPTEYYELNNFEVIGGSKPNTTDVTTYVGAPNNFSGNVPFESVALQGYDIAANIAVNIYGEAYGSYIADPGSPMPTGWNSPRVGNPIQNDVNNNGSDFGNNIYYLGNPYTSNIDLTSKLQADTNFTHIVQFPRNTYVREDGNGELVQSYTGFSLATKDGTGDVNTINQNPFIVRPFHTYIVKMGALGLGDTAFFEFDDSIKTFDDLNAPSFARENSSSTPFYQVGMDLYDDQNDATGNRFYVVASDAYGPAATMGNEAYNIYLGEDTGFYTLQENADGTVSQELRNNPVYINGVNATDYVAKPIQLVFQTNQGGTFTLKSRLSAALLNSGNKFYFEDTQTGDVFEITEDFSYTFNVTETDADRFKMYWNGMPEQLSVGDVNLASQTIVFKDNETFKVRFAKDWNTADIYVYNVMGQLVHSAKQVDAGMDYILPLRKQAAAYVVKAVSEDGTVMTKKIVTK